MEFSLPVFIFQIFFLYSWISFLFLFLFSKSSSFILEYYSIYIVFENKKCVIVFIILWMCYLHFFHLCRSALWPFAFCPSHFRHLSRFGSYQRNSGVSFIDQCLADRVLCIHGTCFAGSRAVKVGWAMVDGERGRLPSREDSCLAHHVPGLWAAWLYAVFFPYVLLLYKAKRLSWNGTWVEKGAFPWRVGGDKFRMRFSLGCAFCPCGLPLSQLRDFALYLIGCTMLFKVFTASISSICQLIFSFVYDRFWGAPQRGLRRPFSATQGRPAHRRGGAESERDACCRGMCAFVGFIFFR